MFAEYNFENRPCMTTFNIFQKSCSMFLGPKGPKFNILLIEFSDGQKKVTGCRL